MHASLLFGQLTIANALTFEHKEIFGTKLNMVPPVDFTTATQFLGYQQEATNSSIMALTITSSYDKVAANLTKENLEKQGLVVNYIEFITINNLPAIFIECEQAANQQIFTKYIFAFGTETETVMINGVAPKENQILNENVRKALLTAVYDVNKQVTPLDAVDFKISTLNTDFSFSKSKPNMLVYAKNHKTAEEDADNAVFVAAKAIAKSDITNKREFAVNKIKSLPMQINKITSTVQICINGLCGYEITAKGVNRKTGQEEYAYFVMLFNDLDYYILYGTSGKNFQEHNKSFRKLAQNFQLK
jgi:hypothetical protein